MRIGFFDLSSEKKAKRFTAIFFLFLTLIGLVAGFDYGLNFDALTEQKILRTTVLEYAHYFLGENHPFVQEQHEMGYLRLTDTPEIDHGQSAYYLAVPLLKLGKYGFGQLRAAWQAYTWLWFMAGVWAIYAFMREMGSSRPAAYAGSLLLYLAPRFFAEGHYNSKDVILLVLMLLTVWQGLRFLKKTCYWRGLLFSFLGAMAANLRLPGMTAWIFVGVGALILRFGRRDWSLRMAGIALCTVVSFIGFFVLLTPALWRDPLGYFQYLITHSSSFSRWSGAVLFQGELFIQPQMPLPRYYVLYLMLVTLPVYTLPLAIIGQAATFRDMLRLKTAFFRDERKVMMSMTTLLWLVPLLYAILGRPVLYNSWRHFYFLYAGVVLQGAYGIEWLFKWLKEKGSRRLLAGVLAFGFVCSGAGIIGNHPFQYGYYNFFAGRHLETQMELDYWHVSTVNALRKLLEMREEEEYPLYITGSDESTMVGLMEAGKFSDLKETTFITYDSQAPYYFLNTTSALGMDVKPPQGYRVLFTIESYGNILSTMYEKIPELP